MSSETTKIIAEAHPSSLREKRRKSYDIDNRKSSVSRFCDLNHGDVIFQQEAGADFSSESRASA
jgi:hypothetical protein